LDTFQESQRRALVIADNQLALNAGWSEELLQLELQALQEADFDLSIVGFDDEELARLLAAQEATPGLTDEDAVPEVPEAPISVAGDLWQLGPHTLLVGDATNEADVARRSLPDYLGEKYLRLGFGRYKFRHEPIFSAHVAGQSDSWYGDKSLSTLWEENKPSANRLHPTMKPVKLIERALVNSSKAGDIVTGLFGGSGSTMIACERGGRIARLMELDPRYADVICRRYQEYAGKKARAGWRRASLRRTRSGMPERGVMNRALPPGDCGSGSGDPRGAFRCGRALSGTGGLVRRITAAATALRIGQPCTTLSPRSLRRRGLGVEGQCGC
jgi:hypothetical protein